MDNSYRRILKQIHDLEWIIKENKRQKHLDNIFELQLELEQEKQNSKKLLLEKELEFLQLQKGIYFVYLIKLPEINVKM